MRPGTKKTICAFVSLAILVAVWLSIDRRELLRTLAGTHLGWFAVAMLFFVPQKALQAVRWRRMARSFCRVGFGEALRLILAGDALNLVLPSKMGDLSKAIFLRSQGRLPLAHGLNLVVFEKMLDTSALCVLLTIGVVAVRRFDAIGVVSLLGALGIIGITGAVCLSPAFGSKRWTTALQRWGSAGVKARVAHVLVGAIEVVGDLAGRGASLALLAALSVAIWVLHLLQIYTFFLALRAPVPFLDAMALVPVAIFIGLLPITVAGIGTRDAALIFLFRPYQGAAAMAGVALLTHLRYLVPGLAGLPFFHRYLREIRAFQADRGENREAPDEDPRMEDHDKPTATV